MYSSSSDSDNGEDKSEVKQISQILKTVYSDPNSKLLKTDLRNSETENILKNKLKPMTSKIQKVKKEVVSSSNASSSENESERVVKTGHVNKQESSEDSESDSSDTSYLKKQENESTSESESESCENIASSSKTNTNINYQNKSNVGEAKPAILKKHKVVTDDISNKKIEVKSQSKPNAKDSLKPVHKKLELSVNTESGSSDTSDLKKQENESTSESESDKNISVSSKSNTNINYQNNPNRKKRNNSVSQSKCSEEDEKKEMDKVERNKVHVLQDVTLSPVEVKTPKDKLNMLYPDLKNVETKVNLKFPNCDVHLFRIPSSVNPLLLLNKEINLEEKCKIKLNEKYVIEATAKLSAPTLVVSNHSKILNLRKNFIMTRYVKTKKRPQISFDEKNNVKLPDNLKERHPLFGPSFKDKINLSNEVEKKLEQAIADVMKKKTKKQKKVKKTKQELQEDHNNEVIYDLLNNIQSTSGVKIKTEISDDSAFSSCGSSINSKKKTKKDNESLFIKPSNNIKQELGTSHEVAKNKVHKKKKTQKQELEKLDTSSQDTLKIDVANHTPNKKKKINSTVIADESTISYSSPDLSFIKTETLDTLKKAKKLKRKHTSQKIIEDSRTTSILDDIPKKVKKKKKERSPVY